MSGIQDPVLLLAFLTCVHAIPTNFDPTSSSDSHTTTVTEGASVFILSPSINQTIPTVPAPLHIHDGAYCDRS